MPKRKADSSFTLTDPQTRTKLSDSVDRRRRANEVKVETLKVPHWTGLRKPPKEHRCGHECLEPLSTSTVHLPYTDRDRVCSPYFVPLLHGWTRRRIKEVTGMAERMRITIDMFTFNVDAEPEKLATGLGSNVLSDISNGRERVPIRAVNNVDDKPWPDFVYKRERTILMWKGKDTNDANAEGYRDDCSGCDCQDDCLDATKCKCQQVSAAYDGRILKEDESTEYDGNRECNHKCACRRKLTPTGSRSKEHEVDQDPVEICVNRVAQNPLNIPLEVYQTADHGWAARSRVWLPPGRHMSNYTAPYLSESTAKSAGRRDSVYLMDVDYCRRKASKKSGKKNTPDMFVIDCRNVGNVGRFFSHSCEPNMTCHNVFTDTHDVRLPVIALFTNKVVEPGDPLTFHYGSGYVSVDKKTGITMMAGTYPCGCDQCAETAKAK